MTQPLPQRHFAPGRLTVIGLGPGDPALQTPLAVAALASATDIVGYGPYMNRLEPEPGQRLHVSDNRQELARARLAIMLAAQGRRTVLVSAGDAGVFGMASAVFEAVETGEPEWRTIDIDVVPGVSAMFAVAARVGAPLGHDFCAISLSDNLKPWETVKLRLSAAAAAGFVIAIYNPASRARPWQLGAALELLGTILPPTTPVVFATAVTRAEETVTVVPLAEADPALADMRTLVLVGSAGTRLIKRPGRRPWVYTSRRAAPVPA